LISKLLQISDPIEPDGLRRLLLDDDSDEARDARTVLAAALSSSRAAGATDAEQIYKELCEGAPEQLAEAMVNTPAERFSLARIAHAQGVLKDQLTSKAGRPATGSPEARQAQLASAQARRRERLAKEENRKQINEWISTGAAERLARVQQLHNCQSRAEALELVLQEDVLAALLARSESG
jgi:hypothetical protein